MPKKMSNPSSNRSTPSMRSTKSSKSTKSTKSGPRSGDLSGLGSPQPLESDILSVHVQNLVVSDSVSSYYKIKVTFCDQVLVDKCIRAIRNKYKIKEDINDDEENALAEGTMYIDTADYKRMSLLADNPLVVTIRPINVKVSTLSNIEMIEDSASTLNMNTVEMGGNSCNVDILPIFVDEEKIVVRKRMEPMEQPPFLLRKSWDNLPLLIMQVKMTRNPMNEQHHKHLMNTNYMKVTVIAAYNMLVSSLEQYSYTISSQMPVYDPEENYINVNFNRGFPAPRNFDILKSYPHWETLRLKEHKYCESDDKFTKEVKDIANESNIDLEFYMKNNYDNVIVWNSFHRTLLLCESNSWLWDYLRKFCWPIKLTVSTPQDSISFMAHLNLSRLLYAGETSVLVATPLYWFNAKVMLEICGQSLGSSSKSAQIMHKSSRLTTESVATTKSSEGTGTFHVQPTGADDNNAWILVEVTLAKPLKEPVLPTIITESEMTRMLEEMEEIHDHRNCSGRGRARDWHTTVQAAAASLKRIPYYSKTSLCDLNRQLAGTRTRIEVMTSLSQDAALWLNDNCIVQEYLHSKETYQEMLILTHACLMREAEAALVQVDFLRHQLPTTLRAARHARQLQDIKHAKELYLQYVVENPTCCDAWRELGTCLKDVNTDCVTVCMTRSLELDMRHPLTLLSMGCVVFEEEPDEAEPFFEAILLWYPFWTTGWVASHAFYYKREMFHIADRIMMFARQNQTESLTVDMCPSRWWENELGDWWDHTPIVPGASLHHDAADLLLRLRAIPLAEVAVASALAEGVETAPYFHQLGLCFRLRHQMEAALCHVRTGLKKFGEISYLKSLEADCLYKLGEHEEAVKAIEHAGTGVSAYTILLYTSVRDPIKGRSDLVDLLRRQPNAYAWIALADDWKQRAIANSSSDDHIMDSCAILCAEQALRIDRRFARAWAFLSILIRTSARSKFCRDMASACGYDWPESSRLAYNLVQSSSQYTAKQLNECFCYSE